MYSSFYMYVNRILTYAFRAINPWIERVSSMESMNGIGPCTMCTSPVCMSLIVTSVSLNSMTVLRYVHVGGLIGRSSATVTKWSHFRHTHVHVYGKKSVINDKKTNQTNARTWIMIVKYSACWEPQRPCAPGHGTAATCKHCILYWIICVWLPRALVAWVSLFFLLEECAVTANH